MDPEQTASWAHVVPVALISSALGALVGAFINHRFTLNREREKSKITRQRHITALRAEVDHCAKLARTYLNGPTAPLYRFPSTVFKGVYPTLVSEVFDDFDVSAFTAFYSQVEQMNRGLDAADGYRASNKDSLFDEEVFRLRSKAAEMAHPTESMRPPSESGLYLTALTSLSRHLPKCQVDAKSSVAKT